MACLRLAADVGALLTAAALADALPIAGAAAGLGVRLAAFDRFGGGLMSCTVGGFSVRALFEARIGDSTTFAAVCAVALALDPRPFLLAFERLAGCAAIGSGCVSAFRFLVLAGRLLFAAGSFARRAIEEAPVRVPGIGAVVQSATV